MNATGRRATRTRTRRRMTGALAAVAALSGAAAWQQTAVAADPPTVGTYEVVVSNTMNGEPMSGPVLATHKTSRALFREGAAAGYGVVQIAENGNNEPLYKQLSYLKDHGQVTDVVDYRTVAGSYPGPIPLSALGLASKAKFPSTSKTMTIRAAAGDRLSWVSMLVCTNDGFTGHDGLALPGQIGRPVTYGSYAYETSTETDSQLLANIMVPCQALTGRHPADGQPGQNVSTTAAFPGPGTFPDAGALAAAQYPGTVEGGVIVRHPGIRPGVGDLGDQTAPTAGGPSNDDLFRWNTELPVAQITITRVR